MEQILFKGKELTPSEKLELLRANCIASEFTQIKISFTEEDLDEIDPKFQGAMDVLSSIPGVDKIAQIDPFLAGVTLVGMLAGGLIAAPKIESGIKALIAKIKDPKKKAQLAAAAEKEGVGVQG